MLSALAMPASMISTGFSPAIGFFPWRPSSISANVATALCRTRNIPVIIAATGRVEASASVAIRSQVGGILHSVHFTEGQEVQRGDELFSIDPRPYQAQLKAKEALLAALRAYRGTVVLVSHDSGFVAELAPDRAVLMPEGEVAYFDESLLDLVALA